MKNKRFIFFIILILFFSSLIDSFSFDKITITAIGDIMAHKDLQEWILLSKEHYLKYFDTTKKIFLSDDLTIANLETPVCDKQDIEGFPTFNAKAELIEAIISSGIELVSFANNHTLDQGYTGIEATIETFKKNKLKYAGAGSNRIDANKPLFFSVKGINIGYISATSLMNYLPQYDITKFPSVNFIPLDNDKIIKSFCKLITDTKKLVDIVIVSFHAGVEYSQIVNKLKEKRFKEFTEAGADVILGHHPHVIQKVEYHLTKDKRKCLIAYSLGNFISAQARYVKQLKRNDKWIYDSLLAKTAESILLQFDIVKYNNKYIIIKPRIIPYYNIVIRKKISDKLYHNGYRLIRIDHILQAKQDDIEYLDYSLKAIKNLVKYRLDKIKEVTKIPVVFP